MVADERARPPWLRQELYPFEDHWAEVDGNLVHYVDDGAGPPILLLDSNPSWSFGWRDVIRELRRDHRCIAPDYPGFGLSKAAPGFDFKPESQQRVIEALVEQLGLDDLTIVGYGWGGPIGLGLAAGRPTRIRGLVLGNTWAWPDRRLRVRLFSALFGGPLSWLLVGRLNLLLRLYLPLSLKRARLTAAERADYAGPFLRGSHDVMRVFPRELTASAEYLRRVESGLDRLAALPTLLLWGDSDVAFGAAALKRLRGHLPRAQVVHLARTGPFVDEDAPEDVAGAIRTWWSATWPSGES